MNGFITNRELRHATRGMASVIARVQSERRTRPGQGCARAVRLACHWSYDPLLGRPVARWSTISESSEPRPLRPSIFDYNRANPPRVWLAAA
jgi:hypothetical protein